MFRRLIQTSRGRLLLLLCAVAVVVLSTAALNHLVLDRFDDLDEAIWSATLHLLDPAHLESDETILERSIGMFQVVTGIVLLVGVLFTLVAESVGASIERLGTLQAPTRERGHLLVVGAADQLRQAARALSYAAELGDRLPPVVALAPHAAQPRRNTLLAELRHRAAPLRVELLFGDVGEESGFALGGAERADTVLLLPGSGSAGAQAADVEVMRAGLALHTYLREREGRPQVRLQFRRGRDVDAMWDLFPDDWDAIVGDRVTSALLRFAITEDELPDEVEALLDPHGRGERDLLAAARATADREGRRPRLSIVGVSNSAPALMADFARHAARAPQLTMLAERAPFEANLGRTEHAGLALGFRETAIGDPDALAAALAESRPDIVLVTPSPTTQDLRTCDAEATLTLLHTLRSLGPEVPVVAELFLPESVERLPGDRRLQPLSSMEAVAGALALSIFEPERSDQLEQRLRTPA